MAKRGRALAEDEVTDSSGACDRTPVTTEKGLAMAVALIRYSRRLLYPLLAVLVFASGYVLGRLQHMGQADPGGGTPASSHGSANAGTGLAGGLPFAPPGRGGASDWIGSLTESVPDNMATPGGGNGDTKDVHQLEMMDQELALLERETISEMAQSMVDSGVPDHDIQNIVNGVAVRDVERGNRVEWKKKPGGLPRTAGRSKEDFAQELKASLLNASASDADVEGMVNSLFLDLESLVLPDYPEPQIPPPPVP